MKFRLSVGQHEEVCQPKRILHDGTLAFKRYKMGDIIDTPLDLNKLNGPHPKFEQLFDGDPRSPVADDPNVQPWDAAKETLEQFVDRMRAKGVAAPALPPHAQEAARHAANMVNPQTTLSGGNGGAKAAAQLEAMNEKDLRSMAMDNNIDVRNCKTKVDVVREIRKSLS